MSRSALVVVDVQNSFCPGGSLAVDGGDRVAADVKEFIGRHGDGYTVILATKDWHIDPGDHFGDPPAPPKSWPHHCVAGTDGADFHPNLDSSVFRHVFYKGMTSGSYSGFEGVTHRREPDRTPGAQYRDEGDDWVTLGEYLQGIEVEIVDILGIATDHCVKETALDAVKLLSNDKRRKAFEKVIVLKNLCAGVDPLTTKAAINTMERQGVLVLTSVEPL